MDNAKQKSDIDNHNTNQNEATSVVRVATITDKFQEALLLSPSSGHPLEVSAHSDAKPEFSTTDLDNIPTVIITPPSPTHDISRSRPSLPAIPHKDDEEQISHSNPTVHDLREKDGDANTDTDRNNVKGIDLDLSAMGNGDILKASLGDSAVNISRSPDCSSEPVSRSIDTTNDDDIEVICRYSSTPVQSTTRASQSLDNTGQAMPLIDNTSPITPFRSRLSTPNQSSCMSPNIAHDDSRNEDKHVHMRSQNPLYMHAPGLGHPSNHPACAQDDREQVNHKCGAITAAYDAGRGVNVGYINPSHIQADTFCGSQENMYPNYMAGAAGSGYNDYYPASESSWTDMGYRSDMSSVQNVHGGPSSGSCCYSQATNGGLTDADYFVYPSIYVSSAGLISVLLKNDMSVEMTVDRTIRVVSHNHMMAVATDSRGTSACLYHPAVKVFQMSTTTDIATDNFRARMGGADSIVFSNGASFFKLEDSELQPIAPIKFSDILRDQSVNLLFSSEGYGESLVASCMQVAAQAEYANLPKGGVIVRINGVKVTQTGGGDVTVVTGAKFIRLSPHYGTTRLGNRFVDIEVEKDWTVKLNRGTHSFVYSRKRAMVCNGKLEAGFDENNSLKVINLQPRHPLIADPLVARRVNRKPIRVVTPTTPATRKRRAGPPCTGRGGAVSFQFSP